MCTSELANFELPNKNSTTPFDIDTTNTLDSSILRELTWAKPSLKIGTANAICWNSLGLLRDYSLNYIYFFKNKTFLFFKIECWSFQHLFGKEFCETSQNFNSIRQWIQNMEIEIVWMSWMSWMFVRFHEILFQTDAESFSFLSWKTKKFYS